MAYNELKTLERCDSLVEAQRSVIIEQDTLLMALEAEAIEYSNQVALLDKKSIAQDTIIVEQRNTIDELKCAYNWKIRKPFWAGYLGGNVTTLLTKDNFISLHDPQTGSCGPAKWQISPGFDQGISCKGLKKTGQWLTARTERWG